MGLLTRVVTVAVVVAAACGVRATSGPTMRTIHYGDDPAQFGEMTLPAGREQVPVAVLLHGGFWLQRYRLGLVDPLVDDLSSRGYAVYNLEYRRVGGSGGWPATFLDVALGIDRLATLGESRLDLDRVVVIGHSAGGHLALWAAGRGGLPADAPGGVPDVRPCAVVGQAAVADLSRAAEDGLGGGAASRLMGGPPGEVFGRYAVGDPARNLPLPVPVLLVHGEDDALVPPAMTRRFAEAAREAGGEIEVAEVAGDHFTHLDPAGPAWQRVVRWLRSGPCSG